MMMEILWQWWWKYYDNDDGNIMIMMIEILKYILPKAKRMYGLRTMGNVWIVAKKEKKNKSGKAKSCSGNLRC